MRTHSQLTKSWAPLGEGTEPEDNLTLRYYGLKALEWLQKQRLTAEMRALLENRTRYENIRTFDFRHLLWVA